ncbi:heparan sulfate 2-O-sulfotransferase pipe-like [Lucilia sericata]|uniref:heparan sulfate 2-O-sulfotransferase pipe-like n=1 Tax=Lucilia sericata TaxID=13632 RepID=UPI0018A84214|nr:heparan sulfate 2-O-sulfotransferase pipe-like [Lucilia sericata]
MPLLTFIFFTLYATNTQIQLESLNAQHLNNTRNADVDILFFNRLEKVGSISMIEFLNTLSPINDFIPHRNAPYKEKTSLESPEDEFELAEELMELPEASSYVEHTNYINFTKLELPRPIYMNLVRHPIQKLESLNAQHLNNTRLAERDILFFNRLEKVGSVSMAQLIKSLSLVNNFIPHRNAAYDRTPQQLTPEVETEFAEELMSLPDASSYVEHTNWINFTMHDLPRPIYMNLIRHPVQKVISAYYFLRTPAVYARYSDSVQMTTEELNMSFNECVKRQIKPYCVFDSHTLYNRDWRRFSLHFCGNKKICKQFNSQTATQIAKRNIEQDYAVVGTWEETNITLTVLEHYIPRFFKDATKIFYSDGNKYHKNATPHKTELEPEVEAKLKIQFGFEIELYNFCLQRLYKQYIAIKKDEMMKKFGGYNIFPFNILT